MDELVVVDPAAGKNLLQYLEPEPITDRIIGPRRFVRPAPHYSKPCIVSAASKLSRGEHFAQHPKLHGPVELYLFHLKFCDLNQYAGAMDRRNAITAEMGDHIKGTAIGRHWFGAARGEDREMFEGFADLTLEEGFDLGFIRKRMHRSFRPRGDTGIMSSTVPI